MVLSNRVRRAAPAATPAPTPRDPSTGGFGASGLDDLSNFNAAALLKDWTATGQVCRIIEAAGIDDDVATQLIGPRSPASNLADLSHPVAEIGDRGFDLLKPRRPPTLLFGG
jgi:hypothetical protein